MSVLKMNINCTLDILHAVVVVMNEVELGTWEAVTENQAGTLLTLAHAHVLSAAAVARPRFQAFRAPSTWTGSRHLEAEALQEDHQTADDNLVEGQANLFKNINLLTRKIFTKFI